MPTLEEVPRGGLVSIAIDHSRNKKKFNLFRYWDVGPSEKKCNSLICRCDSRKLVSIGAMCAQIPKGSCRYESDMVAKDVSPPLVYRTPV